MKYQPGRMLHANSSQGQVGKLDAVVVCDLWLYRSDWGDPVSVCNMAAGRTRAEAGFGYGM
jgi:hypothetical protein